MQSAPARRVLALLLLVPLAACGVAQQNGIPSFQIAGIGPGGGSIAAGDVALTVPAGAFVQDVAVSILPQQDPLAIAPPAADPCTYTYLGPKWCCGPVGHPLVQNGTLVVTYDPALIPAGRTAADLVLLVWDNAAGVMRPDPTAVHDIPGMRFEKTNYTQLGHVAVGVRTCTGQAPGFGVIGQGGNPIIAGPLGVVGGTGIYAGSALGGGTDFVQLGDGVEPFSCVPSPDGTHILLETFGQSENTIVETVAVAGGPPQLIFDSDSSQGGFLETGGGLLGWLLEGDARDVYLTQFVFSQLTASLPNAATLGPPPSGDHYRFSRVSGPSGGAPTPFHYLDLGAFAFIDDFRQSPDGSHVLLRVSGGFSSQLPDRIVIVEVSTCTIVSDDVIPAGGGQHTPRFLPDSSGVYYVSNDGANVLQRDLDGSGETTLWPTGSPGSTYQDAVLASDGRTLALINRPVSASSDNLCYVDTQLGPSGTLLEQVPLAGTGDYDEVIWNPVENVLYIAFDRGPITPFTFDGEAAQGTRIVQHPDLPASRMADLDINRVSGDLLHVVRSQDISTSGLTTGPGLCLTDARGENGEPLQGPPTLVSVDMARWLATVRLTPQRFADNVR